MRNKIPDHYATLGLHRRCTSAQIRDAYRAMAKLLHPDVNGGSPDAVARTQALNAAYETLTDPDRRRAYDRELGASEAPGNSGRTARVERDVRQDAFLRIEDFLRGASLEIRLNDPANPEGIERYELIVPPMTAPGARFRVPRAAAPGGGFVIVRVKARPDLRFRPRGSDLRGELRISAHVAKHGGTETMRGPSGAVRISIPRGVARGEILRIPGEGLPKSRGGRGDLLVRLTYRPEIAISRRHGR